MLRLWRRRRVVDVQISARDLTLAALYVAGEVDYRRRLHCVVYWIVEEVEAALQNPFCGCKPTWRLGPTDVFPYRYGPYSFAVADALEALKAEGLVEEEPAAAYAPCLGAAVKVYKLRLTERGREAARQTAANRGADARNQAHTEAPPLRPLRPPHEDVQRPRPIPRR